MKILLTNDDGIHAQGINDLFDVLSRNHEVYAVAPDKERSACSNAITVRSELKIKEVAPRKYSVSGFPADCVNIGVNGNIVPEPDVVISGINHGPNVGDDIHFSGTAAGGRTAFIYGKHAISLSLDCYHKPSDFFIQTSEFIMSFVEDMLAQKPDKPFFYNVNCPNLPQEQIKGVKYTFVGTRLYRDKFKIKKQGDEFIYQLDGEMSQIPKDGSDITELDKGYISITPLMLDNTDFAELEQLINQN